MYSEHNPKAGKLCRITTVFVLLLLFLFSGQGMPAQQPADETRGDTYTVMKKKIKEFEKERDDADKQLEKQYKTVKDDFTSQGVASVPKAEKARLRSKEDIKNLDAFIQAAKMLEKQIDESKNPADRDAKMRELGAVLTAARHIMTPIRFNSGVLEDLQRRADIAVGQGNYRGMRVAFSEAGREEDGGGIYLNETALVPLNRKDVSGARYDTNTERFILQVKGRQVFTPPMDPELTAVAIRCLKSLEPGQRQLAMSLDIDPVNMRRIEPAIYGHQSVVFNSKYLEDTQLGLTMLNSDMLLESIWMGKNREGVDLAKTYNYHSLSQTMLDHPAVIDILQRNPNPKFGFRWWIKPTGIEMYLSSRDTLSFRDVSFQMFTETIRFQEPNPKWFKGEFVPNPGADVFCKYFNENFRKFEGFPMPDVNTGRSIQPFKQLKEAAKITGFLRWLMGAHGEAPIQMDTTWAERYPVKKIDTPGDVLPILLHDVEKEIRVPIQIYNEYGLSRMIDEKGRTTRFIYDRNGRLTGVQYR